MVQQRLTPARDVGLTPETSALSDRVLLRRLAVVGLPFFPTAVGARLLGLFGAALVGHLDDTAALAAVGLSSVITNITGFSWLSGLSSGISTLSSQAWGAQAYHSVGVELQRGFLIILCFADVPLIVFWLSSEWLLVALGQPPDVARLVGLYTRIRIPGIFCETLNTVVREHQDTKPWWHLHGPHQHTVQRHSDPARGICRRAHRSNLV